MGRLLAFLGVTCLAAAGGGWSSVSWGLATVGLAWAAAVALVLGPERPTRLQLAFLGGVTALAAWIGLSALWSLSVPSSVLEAERAAVYVAGVAAAVLVFRRGAEDGVLAAAAVVCAWNLVERAVGAAGTGTGAGAEPIGYANGVGLLAAIGCVLALRRRETLPALAVCVPALVLAQSAGSWLALAAGVVVAFRPRLAPLVAVAVAVAVAVGMHSHRRGDYWDVALAGGRAQPVLGSGAGTYDEVWVQRRPDDHQTLDAHSLELESLAELGAIGLLLVAGTVVVPFLGGGGVALGGFAAWVVQSGIDWEWELPAVTLAGLFCAVAALRAPAAETVVLSMRARAAGACAAVALGLAATLGLAGNLALHRAADALRRGDTAAAASEARGARRLVPWSAEPYRIEDEARGGDPRLIRQALDRDPNDWSLWARLAAVAAGPERERAARKAARLNPLFVPSVPSG